MEFTGPRTTEFTFYENPALRGSFNSGEPMDRLPTHDKIETYKTDLTPREREVLSCITAGGSNKEIADKLFISEKTVKTHVNSILRKLHVTRRLQAILYAIHKVGQ